MYRATPYPPDSSQTSVVVAGNGMAPEQDNPSSFQEQLMSRIRLRSLSNEVPTASSSLARSQENIYSLPAFTTPPLPRASNSMSAGASARTGPPPVSSKPARPPTVASKPSRAGYLQTGQLLTSKMCSCISLCICCRQLGKSFFAELLGTQFTCELIVC